MGIMMDLSEARAVLGVSPGADREAVKAAYRRAAMRHHPDRDAGGAADGAADAEAFLRVKTAYDILTGRIEAPDGAARSGPSHAGEGPGQPRPRDGAHLTATVEITLEQAIRGGTFAVRADAALPCAACGGGGRVPLRERVRCRDCGGAGASKRTHGLLRVRVKCTACGGAGWFDSVHCENCEGSGRNQLPGDVEFDLRPGAADGDIVKLEGYGEPGRHGGRSGDLDIALRVRPHARFRRRGNDLAVDLCVSFADLCLGGRAAIETLEGGRAAVPIRPGTRTGAVVALRGLGMPDGAGGRGDLMVRLQAAVPGEPTPEQEALLRRWRTIEKGG